jgi:hypothetical protein
MNKSKAWTRPRFFLTNDAKNFVILFLFLFVEFCFIRAGKFKLTVNTNHDGSSFAIKDEASFKRLLNKTSLGNLQNTAFAVAPNLNAEKL